MPPRIVVFLLLALPGFLCLGCEIDTSASGAVTDSVTGLALDSVQVIELAVQRKQQFVLADTHTDSSGRFEFNAGLFGTGGRRTRLILLFDKVGYYPVSVENNGGEIRVSLHPH